MKRSIILFSVLFFFLISCKKESHNQFSYWYVGNDSFSSNNVGVVIEPYGIDLNCNNIKNSFGFTFENNYHLPVSGNFLITDSLTDDPTITNEVGPGFHYMDSFYTVSKSAVSYLHASSVNGKAEFTLDSTWFINYNNPNDSVIIHGIFNQP
jgi:hypothetical protein